MVVLRLEKFVNFIMFGWILGSYIQAIETPAIKYLRKVEVVAHSNIGKVDCIYVINLDERPEKWACVKRQFDQYGLAVTRVSGINGWNLQQAEKEELFGPYPVRCSPGHIGCMLSHLSIIRDAFERGLNVIWAMEDDVEILEDPRQVTDLLKALGEIDPEWDILYTDVDFRNGENYTRNLSLDPRPGQGLPHLLHFVKRVDVSEDFTRMRYRYGAHSLLISRRGIEKLHRYFMHVYFWTHYDNDMHYVPGIKQYSLTRDIVSNLRVSISDTHKSDLQD